MTNTKITRPAVRRTLAGLCAVSAVFICFAATAAAQVTTTEKVKGATTVATRNLSGVVKYVEGNTLVVRMSTGELRTFNVPDTQKFAIDGQTVTVHDLQPGTSLNA